MAKTYYTHTHTQSERERPVCFWPRARIQHDCRMFRRMSERQFCVKRATTASAAAAYPRVPGCRRRRHCRHRCRTHKTPRTGGHTRMHACSHARGSGPLQIRKRRPKGVHVNAYTRLASVHLDVVCVCVLYILVCMHTHTRSCVRSNGHTHATRDHRLIDYLNN